MKVCVIVRGFPACERCVSVGVFVCVGFFEPLFNDPKSTVFKAYRRIDVWLTDGIPIHPEGVGWSRGQGSVQPVEKMIPLYTCGVEPKQWKPYILVGHILYSVYRRTNPIVGENLTWGERWGFRGVKGQRFGREIFLSCPPIPSSHVLYFPLLYSSFFSFPICSSSPNTFLSSPLSFILSSPLSPLLSSPLFFPLFFTPHCFSILSSP